MLTQTLKDEYARLCYKGGAGPTPEQAEQLTTILFNALKAAGLNAVVEDGDHFGTLVRVDSKIANYDRWGYSTIHCGSIDNVDLETAVAYFLE